MKSHEIERMAEVFFRQLELELKDNHVELLPHWSIDHICYRVETLDRYQIMKRTLLKLGKELVESDVNGRPIATFKLDSAIYFGERKIDLIELPAPKRGKDQKEGFEHIEVVCDESFEDLRKRYDQCHFIETGLFKDFNPELAIKLRGCVVKFHHLSLESVVNLEVNQKVYSAIEKSGVLKYLKKFNPQVVGTFPLGISVLTSDVDILIEVKDFILAKKEIKDRFDSCDRFSLEEGATDNLKYFIVRFNFNQIPFELFAQAISPFRQRAYKHFNIEERLLKIGNSGFKNHILRLRREGKKTEAAFAEALGLDGDPFQSLLDIQTLSSIELINRFPMMI